MEGPNDPTTATNVSFGAAVWTIGPNSFASDNSYDSVDLSPGSTNSDALLLQGFGFSVPGAATIVGIVVEIERWCDTASNAADVFVRLYKTTSGGAIGSNYADAGFWDGSDPGTYVTYGGAADLWGETWTPAEINDAEFGVGLSVNGVDSNAHVDHVRITVYYTQSHSVTGSAEAVISSTVILSQTHAAAGNAEAVISSAVVLSQTHAAAGNAEGVISSAVVLSQTHAASGSAEAVISSTIRLYTGSAIGCVHVTLEPEWDVTITLEPQWEVAIAIAPRWQVTITLEEC